MSDSVFLLGIALIATFFHVRAAQSFTSRLQRATLWSLVIGLVIAGVF